ncbi:MULTISPECIES: glucosylglycerate synthase Ggs [Persephonella]|uniref:Glycosyl transferase, group 2 family n=1 Tax=Persephonella marina (strain DSM 14350 / EX-H1) TaxID=123214 RepID=C0QRQ1_PERMH|nr:MULTISPECIES: glucosylglycerate synthase Ggs [Persephonella]ACO03168.1 glycosyl transferase, group 2 family [Persephonella marina EX-H1]
MMIVLPNVRFSTALREDARKKIEKIGYADIVVGIPSYYSQTTISHVIETVAKGLDRYYSDRKAIIFVSDGGSTDDTREEARATDISAYNIEKIVSIYRGIPGKGSALRAVFEAAEFLRAEAVATFDSDLKSITPEWIKNILDPVFQGFDYVTPYYRRYKFDGTITNNIAYPLIRTLYGLRIRQPIGGDFGMSRKLVKDYLDEDVWETDVAKFGIDIWMTTTAIVKGYRICQARLGAKIHGEKDPAKDLSGMFREVVGTTYNLMEKYETFWKKIKKSKEVPVFGEFAGVEPEPFEIDLDESIDYFKTGYRNFEGVWERILDEEDMKVIKDLFKVENNEEFVMPVETWVRIVYRYANIFHSTERQKFKVLNTMIPLYNARVASLVNELSDKSDQEAEEYYNKQAEVFEEMKDYLIKIWK